MSPELLVLTCASGKQCSHLIPLLQPHFPLRLVVNSPASLHRLQTMYPSADVAQADLMSPAACRRIVAGATSIYHINPPMHPFERQVGFNMIDAAAAEPSVQHFVFSSVLWSQLSKLRHHEQKREIEEYPIESSLRWTILCPTHFIENIPVAMLAAQELPVFQMMFSPETRMSFMVLSELAEVSAKVIRERGVHFYASYPLASTMPVTYGEVLEELGQQLGREVRVDRLSFEDSVRRFMKVYRGSEDGEGLHPVSKETAELMLWHYSHHGLVGNPGVLRWLLGREPMGYAAWFREQIAKVEV